MPGSPVRNTHLPRPPSASARSAASTRSSFSLPTTTGHSTSLTMPDCPLTAPAGHDQASPDQSDIPDGNHLNYPAATLTRPQGTPRTCQPGTSPPATTHRKVYLRASATACLASLRRRIVGRNSAGLRSDHAPRLRLGGRSVATPSLASSPGSRDRPASDIGRRRLGSDPARGRGVQLASGLPGAAGAAARDPPLLRGVRRPGAHRGDHRQRRRGASGDRGLSQVVPGPVPDRQDGTGRCVPRQ